MMDAALRAVHPADALRRHVRIDAATQELILLPDSTEESSSSSSSAAAQVYDLQAYDRIVLLAIGKAASCMAATLVQDLRTCDNQNHHRNNQQQQQQQQPSLTSQKLTGICLTKDGHATQEEQTILANSNVRLYEASHPIPDSRGEKAAHEILDLLLKTAPQSALVLTCISGGGSALLTAPAPPLTLADLQGTNQALLAAGWPIDAMNVLRKRLDLCKGGKLLRLRNTTTPTTWINLVLSDVVGDPLDLIASGPTVPDTSTWEDAQQLFRALPPVDLPIGVGRYLAGPAPTTEKFLSVTDEVVVPYTRIVGNTAQAVHAAAQQARALGYRPVVLATQLQGEAKELAQFFVAMAQHEASSLSSASQQPVAIITGGESTVTLDVKATGKGGRNQEMALAVALGLDRLVQTNNLAKPVVFGSVGTDGTDGPTDAAGAIVDPTTVANLGRDEGRKALTEHNAYPYLGKVTPAGTSPLLKTGPTGTNVAVSCLSSLLNYRCLAPTSY